MLRYNSTLCQAIFKILIKITKDNLATAFSYRQKDEKLTVVGGTTDNGQERRVLPVKRYRGAGALTGMARLNEGCGRPSIEAWRRGRRPARQGREPANQGVAGAAPKGLSQ